jgi:hypothetical protein
MCALREINEMPDVVEKSAALRRLVHLKKKKKIYPKPYFSWMEWIASRVDERLAEIPSRTSQSLAESAIR